MATTTKKKEAAKPTTKPSHDPKFHAFSDELASRVQALRKSNGDTMEELALACGVTRGTIHKIEHPSPQEDLSLATLFAIARRYDTAVSDLLLGIEKAPQRQNDDESTSRWFENEDYLALSVLNEVLALQVRADLSEQACLHVHDEHVLEVLAKHSAKLRKLRYSILKRNL
jgi:transcriptional regulator with XRE-family HTH domain